MLEVPLQASVAQQGLNSAGAMDEEAEGMALLVQARLAARQSHWQEGREALDEALRLAQAMQYPYLETKVLYASGWLSLQQGESAQASEAFAHALAILGCLGERLYAQHIEAALTILREAEPSSKSLFCSGKKGQHELDCSA